MQLQNITFEDSQFNLLLNRYEDTNAIAIMIQEIDEDYCEPVTVSMLPDEDEVFENEIDSELVAIPVDSFKLVNTLIAYGLIEKGPEIVNFFEGVYFYKPTQELLNYMEELKSKYRDAYNGFKEKLKKDRLEAIENNKDKINELKEKLNLDELPEFLIDEIITGGFEYSHQNQKDRAAKLRSNELQQAIKDRKQKQKQNRLFKNPFKN